jgi:hypothetical protein
MNFSGPAKCAGGFLSIAMFAACSRGSSVPPAVATSSAWVEYVGETAFVDGRAVAAARPNLNVTKYAPILSDKTATSNANDFEYIINDYGTYASISTIRKASIKLARSGTSAAKAAPTFCTATGKARSGL